MLAGWSWLARVLEDGAVDRYELREELLFFRLSPSRPAFTVIEQPSLTLEEEKNTQGLKTTG
jgi:hypothetical protein